MEMMSEERLDSRVRRGRKPYPPGRVWNVDRGDPEHNATIAVISMCIKDDFGQTFRALAERVADAKGRPLGECIAVLEELRDKGELGYYDDMTRVWIRWVPEEVEK